MRYGEPNPAKLLGAWIEITKSGAGMFILVSVANKVLC